MPPKELLTIAETLDAGIVPEEVTVRTFLGWFGAHRRGWRVVSQIKDALAEIKVITVPDFESRWIDANLAFSRAADTNAADDAASGSSGTSEAEMPGAAEDEMPPSWTSRDPTYRISKLAAANSGIERVSPDASLTEAVTSMLANDYSQLAVMQNDWIVRGVISWKSIGCRLALGSVKGLVRDFMEPASEVRADVSIFDAIAQIVQTDYVLVRGDGNKITGIVTASDLSLQFRTLTEPFLLLSEIENAIRNMIGKSFNTVQLQEAINPDRRDQPINGVADLTFGQYVLLIEKPDRWVQLNLKLDRACFCRKLIKVRDIRNDVMHFDPDGITSDDLTLLRNFTIFLKTVEEIMSVDQP